MSRTHPPPVTPRPPARPKRRVVHAHERRCDASPTTEHAWRWTDGDLVCCHCDGQRERTVDPWGPR